MVSSGIDMLPPELNSVIFEYACVDGGATARSLSLVSKYIHAVATPFLYQSLTISGSAHLLAVATRLEAHPSDARFVRHLFLSDRPLSSQPSNAPYSVPDPEATSFHTLTLRILSLLAPYLDTLALLLFHYDPYHIAERVSNVLALTYSQLTSLTLHTPHSHTIPLPANCPELTHLHLSGLTLASLPPKSSTVTHLRLTGFGCANSTYILTDFDKLMHRSSAALTSVRRVVVQPEWTPTRWRWGPTPSADELLVCQLERLARMVGKPRFHLTPKPKEKETSNDIYQRLKKDWMERSEGKPGCWMS